MSNKLINTLFNVLITGMIERFDDVSNDAYSLSRFAAAGPTYDDLLKLMESIAENANGEVYEGYSGRGMYGDKCWGITGDAAKIIEIAGAHGVFGANMDSMGRDSIVYWPALKYTEQD
jgi:hypothetical protein